MINVHCPEHLEQVRAFAHEHGAEAELEERLDYLASYGGGANICELHKDFAPYSFEFLMKHPDGSRWFNGGLIYSGPGQPLDGSFPALTVSIGHSEHLHDWSVHT